MLEFDVAVIGDGPTGAAHAAAHEAAGRHVALIGAGAAHPRGTYELLSGRAAPVLHILGVLDTVRDRGTPCAGTVFRWMHDRFAQQNGQQAQWNGGWMIDRHWFDPMVRAAATCRPGVTSVSARVSGAEPDRGGWRVACTRAVNGRTEAFAVRARHLILAGGRTGRAVNRYGVHRRIHHRMVSIVTREPIPVPELGPRLLVDSAADGWWYAMGDGTGTTIGYVTDIDLLSRGPDRLTATWRQAARGVDWLPPGAAQAPLRARTSVVACADLGTDAEQLPLPVGDAGLAADPLSGHGLVLGLRGALHAAADPADYLAWLARQQHEHREQERLLYRAERRYPASAFWRRRGDRR